MNVCVCVCVCVCVLFSEGPSLGPVPEGQNLTVTCVAGCNSTCDLSWTLRSADLNHLSVNTGEHQQESDRECVHVYSDQHSYTQI